MEMIHFIWACYPLLPGAGGSEVYTIGQARELIRRGFKCDVLSIGLGCMDGREHFPDIVFHSIKEEQIAEIDGTCIFVTQAFDTKTKSISYVMLHCPPPPKKQLQQEYYGRTFSGKKLIATSNRSAEVWAKFLNIPNNEIAVAYPFADTVFGCIELKKNTQPTIVFAGRLTPDKGIYTLLCAMHSVTLADYRFVFVRASEYTSAGKIIVKLLEAHPHIELIAARSTPKEMAELLAQCDVLVMPTTPALFFETFGMLSIEAQHTGCRVVASNAGALPETNIGGVLLVEPDNPVALTEGIVAAVKMGRLSVAERHHAKQYFTIRDSVNMLLSIINPNVSS